MIGQRLFCGAYYAYSSSVFFVFCFLLFAIFYILFFYFLSPVFCFMSFEIKVNELRKKQEIRSKKYNCR